MVEILAWTAVIFVVGSALVLERRCLGQMAVVQPLIVCLVAGWLSGQETTAMWLGITLQLLSVDRAKEIDWQLSGVVCAAVLIVSPRLDVALVPGAPEALVALMAAVLTGIGSRLIELKYARVDGQYLHTHSPWADEQTAAAVESVVRRVVIRWMGIGGLEVVVGTVLAVGAILCVGLFGHRQWALSPHIAAVVLVFGAATAVSSLSKNWFLACTGISAAISWMVIV